jgi:hypothetical protein
MMTVTYAECHIKAHYGECHYAGRRYAESRGVVWVPYEECHHNI